jgi:hypothetical protein
VTGLESSPPSYVIHICRSHDETNIKINLDFFET